MKWVSLPDSRVFAKSGLFCRILYIAALSVRLLSADPAAAQKAFVFPGSTAVGSLATQSVTIPIQATGTISQVLVLTGGIPALDYSSPSNSACGTGTYVTSGGSCSLSVTFAPKAPGERRGAVVLLDGAGAILSSAPLYGYATGPVSVLMPATINTVAGIDSRWIYKSGDDGIPATASPIFLPGGIAIDAAGNLFISDSSNNRIRRVDAASDIITTIAGDGTPGSANDGMAAGIAQVSNPGGLILDGAGDLYIADSGNHAIRKLVLATGVLTTIAGQLGVQGSTGDGGLANAAFLNSPVGLALDAAGDLYIADTGNNVVRRIDATTHVITTYAGTLGTAGFSGDGALATAALLNTPRGLATDPLGNLYIADLSNSRVRLITPAGQISTAAGTGSITPSPEGLPPTSTNLRNPAAVAIDVAGNIYIADSGHDLVLKVNASNKLVSFSAGNGSPAFGGDLGPAPKAGMYGPYALTLDFAGNLYIADLFDNRIREVFNGQATLNFSPVRVGSASLAQTEILENDGNSALTWTSFSPDSNSLLSAGNTSCSTSSPLAVDGKCSIAVQFHPQVVGNPVTAYVRLASNATNSPSTITLSGQSLSLTPSTTTLQSSLNPSTFNAVVVFTATVTGSKPTGIVQFFDGTVSLGSGNVSATGVAILSTPTLALGTHDITAKYSGDPLNTPSTAPDLTQVVKQAARVTLTSLSNPTNVGVSTTFIATVASSPTPATGNVIFQDGSTVLRTVALDGSGTAAFTIASLPKGTHPIVAAYQGNATTSAANSAPLSQIVNLWPSAISLSSSLTPSQLGQNVTLTITVSSGSSVTPAGTVTLVDGTTTLASPPLNSGGVATYNVTTLAAGAHSITATFSGDATNGAINSKAVVQTVSKVSTATTSTSSPNPSSGGGSVQLAAVVKAVTSNPFAGALTGTMSFSEGANNLGSATISPGGVATLNLSTLPVGTHTIIANYLGNNSYAASSSSALTQVVQLAVTSVKLISSSNPSTQSNNILFTATTTGNGGIPTGAITFSDGKTALGQGKLNPAGIATFSTAALAVGTHSITATYGGDALDATSTSVALSELIQQTKTAISLISNNNPVLAGTTLSLAATISSNGGLPTGQLQLVEDGTTLATSRISAAGTAQFSLSSLTVGSHSLLVSFAGDKNNGAGTSPVLVQVVNLASSALSLASNVNPSPLGTPVLLTARVTGTGNQPTGTLTFLDGVSVLGTATISSGLASVSTSTLTFGTHSLKVTYAGDSTHNPSTPGVLSQLVQQTTTSALLSSSNPSTIGGVITISVTVAGKSATPTGKITFYDGAASMGTVILAGGSGSMRSSTLAAGPHLLTAKYAGDTNSLPSDSAPLAQVVNGASTSVVITSSVNPSLAGSAVIFSASVISTGDQPTGTVSFMDGSVTLGTSAVTNGGASISSNNLAAGQHAVVARYGGGANTQGSTSGVLVQRVQQHTTTALSSNANPILTGQGFTLTAVVTGPNATGTVTFSDGSTVLGQSALNVGKAVLTGTALSAGAHSLTATYTGDNFNFGSTSTPVLEAANLRPSSTSVTSSSSTYLSGTEVSIVAVVLTNGPIASTGTVTFTAGGVTLGTVTVGSAGTATLIFAPSAHIYAIKASYSGDGMYLPSAAATYTITQMASSGFSLASNPSTVSVASGDHTTLKLTLSSTAPFADTLSLACLDLPVDATCTFSANQATLSSAGTASVQVVVDTGLPLGAGPRASIKNQDHRNVLEAALALPAALLLLFSPFHKRRRHFGPLLVFTLLLTAVGLSGCGSSINVNSTPAGSYAIRVLATGSTTGMTQTAKVALTVQ